MSLLRVALGALLISCCALRSMGAEGGVSLEYNFQKPRVLVYQFRLLSWQLGTCRSDLQVVQDRSCKLSLSCYGEGRLIVEVSDCHHAYMARNVSPDMRCRISCVADGRGRITKVGLPEYDFGDSDLTEKETEDARFLLRSYLVTALNKIVIPFPEEERRLGQSWIDSDRTWPFEVVQDSDVAFSYFLVASLPEEQSASPVRIEALSLDCSPNPKIAGLCTSRTTRVGRFKYDPKEGIGTESVVELESEWVKPTPGKDGKAVTHFGIVKYETMLVEQHELSVKENEQ